MFKLNKVIFLSIICLSPLVDSSAQVNRSGFNFAVGAGFGYSNHAEAYIVEEKLGIIEEYSGFRAFSTNLKVGWGITPRAQVFYTLHFTPPNATISPYESVYHGGIIAYSFESVENLLISAGAGINIAHDMNKGELARGTLGNIAVAYEFSPHFSLELNSIFGKMENNPPPLSFFSSSKEFSLMLTINYLFYKYADE